MIAAVFAAAAIARLYFQRRLTSPSDGESVRLCAHRRTSESRDSYAAGSAALGILALALGSWFWLLLWPAASLALIAIAYVRGSSSVFRKSGGRLPISTRVVLGPYFCGAFARLLIYRQRSEPWVEAAPGVYCGRLLTKREALAVRAMGVAGVLDMTAEHAETRTFLEIEHLNTAERSLQELAYLNTASRSLQEIAYLNVAVEYLNVTVLDLTEPSRESSTSPSRSSRSTLFVAACTCIAHLASRAAWPPPQHTSQQAEPSPALTRSVRSAGAKNLGTRF